MELFPVWTVNVWSWMSILNDWNAALSCMPWQLSEGTDEWTRCVKIYFLLHLYRTRMTSNTIYAKGGHFCALVFDAHVWTWKQSLYIRSIFNHSQHLCCFTHWLYGILNKISALLKLNTVFRRNNVHARRTYFRTCALFKYIPCQLRCTQYSLFYQPVFVKQGYLTSPSLLIWTGKREQCVILTK